MGIDQPKGRHIERAEKGSSSPMGVETVSRPTLGLLIISMGDRYTRTLIQGVADFAEASDVNLVTYLLDGPSDAAEFADPYAVVSSDICDGFVLTAGLAYRGPDSFDLLNDFTRRHKVPKVGISLSATDLPAVVSYGYSGVREAVRHLIVDHELRRIAFIRGPKQSEEANDRYRAYLDTLKSHGLSEDPDLVVRGDFSREGGARATRLLLGRGVVVDAIVCANDDTAVGALDALQEHGIRVPEEIALVGFDDIELAAQLPVPLTTVRQPIYEMGYRSAEHLLARIRGHQVPAEISVETRFVRRQSCGCLPPEAREARSAARTEELSSRGLVSYDDYKPEILSALEANVRDIRRAADLVDAFWSDIRDGASTRFARLLSILLHESQRAKRDVSAWHEAIDILREKMIPLLGNRRHLIRAADLLQQARALVGEAQLRVYAYRQALESQRQLTLQDLSSQLANLMSLEPMLPIVQTRLPELGIDVCHLSVYSDAAARRMQSVLSVTPDQAIIHPSADEFESVQLMPPSAWELLDQRYTMFVLPLYVGDERFGIGTFAGVAADAGVYPSVRSAMAGVLFRTRLAEAQRRAREEAETAGRQAASALRDAVAAQRSYVEGAWEQYATSVRDYVYTDEGLRRADADPSGVEIPGLAKAVERGQLVIETGEVGRQTLSLPLSLYGEEIIGTLGFVREDGVAWTPDQIRMVESVADQVAHALETKRLLSDVQRRAARLTAAAEVSSATTSMTDVDQLLAEAVNLIHDRFGLYYVGIFLVDENDRWAVLVAGTGEAARVMIERGHKLAVEASSMIGLCIVSGVAQMASDVDIEETRFDNPLLPDTRSELALPLTSRGEVIGAMTIQHEMPGAFVGEDITTLQTMADQLANAIQNARLLEQMERSVRELQLATGAYTEVSWRDFVHGRRGQLGYRYRLVDVSPADEPRPEAAQALEAGATIAAPLEEDQTQQPSVGERVSEGAAKAGVGVPIRLRNQVLGVLNLRFEDDYVPPETVQMVEQVADRLAISLESARLLEETQRTAQRERLISEVSQRIRQSLEVDEVLRSSVSEIRGLMDLFKVSVRLAPQSGDGAMGAEINGSKDNGGEDAQDTGA